MQTVGKFIGFALLFNLLLWLFALFAQIRGWVDVTASYLILFAMWIVGTLICLASGAQLRPHRKRLAVVLGSAIWAGALMGLNAIAPKPSKPLTARQHDVQVLPSEQLTTRDSVTAVVPSTAPSPAKPRQIGHRIGGAKAVTVPATQPEDAAPEVRQPFDPSALPEFLRQKPLALERIPQPPSTVRAETSDEILEEIRAVLERDRESEEMQGCPAGASVELRMVGNDISYYLCTRQCFAAWRKVNLRDLDFGGVKVSQPLDDHRLAVVEIPCLHPGTVAGLCLTEEVGTFPSKECLKKKLKTDYFQSFWMTVHTDNVDSLVRLWKEFAQVAAR